MGFFTNARKLRFEKKYNFMVDDKDLQDFSDFGSTGLILSFIFAIISLILFLFGLFRDYDLWSDSNVTIISDYSIFLIGFGLIGFILSVIYNHRSLVKYERDFIDKIKNQRKND